MMSKDQGYGFVIFIISVIVALVYLAAFFSKPLGLDPTGTWQQWAIGIPVLLFVLLVLVIAGWIGWTMLTTPPPAPLETEPQPTAPPEPTRSVSAGARPTSRSNRSTRPRRRSK